MKQKCFVLLLLQQLYSTQPPHLGMDRNVLITTPRLLTKVLRKEIVLNTANVPQKDGSLVLRIIPYVTNQEPTLKTHPLKCVVLINQSS